MRTAISRSVRNGVVVGLLVWGGSLALGAYAPTPVGAAPAKSGKEAADPFTRGTELFKQGRLDEALTAFREEESRNPKEAIVQSWIGFVYFNKGKVLDEQAAGAPTPAAAQAKRAQAQAQYQEAIKYLKQSISLNGNNPDTYNNLGNAYFSRGDTDSAIEAYRQAAALIKDRPDRNPGLYFNLGNALVKKGELDQALNAFLEAERQAPDDPEIQNNLGFIYERKSRDSDAELLANAVEHYRKAADKEPNNAYFQRNLGLAARKAQGQDELAMRALKKAAQLNARDYAVQVALAEEYQNQKQTEQAITCYKNAVQIRPKEFVPRYNLGLLFARQAGEAASPAVRTTKYEAATQQLLEAVKLNPTDARVLSALGWVYFKLEDWKNAAIHFQKAITADPDLQSAYVNLGLTMEKLEKPEEAIKAFREALKRDATDVTTRKSLALAYLNKKLYQQAVGEYQEAIKLDPKDPLSYNNLGFALERLKKVDEAIAAYKQAIAVDPRFAMAHNNLGACYEQQGNKELAKQCYTKALQINPGNEDAKKNLARLNGG